MRSSVPGGNDAPPVDLRNLASAIPSIGLAPDAIARADVRSNVAKRRGTNRFWAWQFGNMLLMLDHLDGQAWVLSELAFDNAYGYYLEQRRSAYASPREAAGVALALALRLGVAASLSAAASLDAWSSLAFADQIA
jgi:hypothetical protein